jgi:hypothetical protein
MTLLNMLYISGLSVSLFSDSLLCELKLLGSFDKKTLYI